MKNIFIYNRVSTQKQSNSLISQREELMMLSKSNNWNVVKIYDDVVSGYSKNDDRHILNEMIEEGKGLGIDMILIHELSRIGRSVDEVISTINKLNDLGISLYVKTNGIETLIDGKVNPMTTFMISILSSVNQMEKSITQTRLQRGRDSYIRNGGKVGRPTNTGLSKDDLLSKHKDVVKLLKGGMSIRKTSKLTDKSVSTIQRVKMVMN